MIGLPVTGPSSVSKIPVSEKAAATNSLHAVVSRLKAQSEAEYKADGFTGSEAYLLGKSIAFERLVSALFMADIPAESIEAICQSIEGLALLGSAA
jgi:hypothetical protein